MSRLYSQILKPASIIAVLVLTCVTANSAKAEEFTFFTKDGKKSNKLVNITADKMLMFSKKNLVIFSGNVTMVSDDIHMSSDRLELTFSGSGGKDSDIETVVSEGNVRIVQGDNKMTSGRAEFYQKEEKIVLTQDPELLSPSYQIKGAKITTLLRENKSIVEKSEVTIQPTK